MASLAMDAVPAYPFFVFIFFLRAIGQPPIKTCKSVIRQLVEESAMQRLYIRRLSIYNAIFSETFFLGARSE